MLTVVAIHSYPWWLGQTRLGRDGSTRRAAAVKGKTKWSGGVLVQLSH